MAKRRVLEILALSVVLLWSATLWAETGTITGNKLRLRSHPTTKKYKMVKVRNKIIGKFKKGSEVKILKEITNKEGRWYKVQSKRGHKGWVKADFVQVKAPVLEDEPVPIEEPAPEYQPPAQEAEPTADQPMNEPSNMEKVQPTDIPEGTTDDSAADYVPTE